MLSRNENPDLNINSFYALWPWLLLTANWILITGGYDLEQGNGVAEKQS